MLSMICCYDPFMPNVTCTMLFPWTAACNLKKVSEEGKWKWDGSDFIFYEK